MARGRKPAEGLTEKQREILKLMIAFVCRNGHQPTRDELAARTGTTPHAVTQKIWSLRDKGYLVMGDSKTDRSLTIRGVRFEACLEPAGLSGEQKILLQEILAELDG